MKFETLGDWCKWLEKSFSPEIMIPTLPVIIRLDGNNFHNWTNGLERPFDEKLTDIMIELTKYLVDETNAVIGYTQSDEITLVLYEANRHSSLYHIGKKQKILSKLTSKASVEFNRLVDIHLPNHNKIAIFDSRIYQTPTLEDAVAQLLWRENDATKNSVSMLAQSFFSHKQLQNKNGDEMKKLMLHSVGVNWKDLPDKFRKGTYVKRSIVSSAFTKEELDTLPPKHQAHTNPDLVVERSRIQVVHFPPLNEVEDKVKLVFGN